VITYVVLETCIIAILGAGRGIIGFGVEIDYGRIQAVRVLARFETQAWSAPNERFIERPAGRVVRDGDLQEGSHHGSPESGQAGIVNDVERGDLGPRLGGSAQYLPSFLVVEEFQETGKPFLGVRLDGSRSDGGTPTWLVFASSILIRHCATPAACRF